MDPGLLNSYTRHIENGGSLTYHFPTFSSIVHTIPAGQDFNVNQTRAFTKLDTVFVNFARQELEGTVAPGTPADRVTDTWWFEGLNSDTAPGSTIIAKTGNADRLEYFFQLGPKRFPHFSPQRTCEHFFQFLKSLGKHNSDVHSPGITQKQWRYNSMTLAYDFEKASGSGAEWSGESTRGGDILAFNCKHAPPAAQRCYVFCHHTVIARVSKSGVDFSD